MPRMAEEMRETQPNIIVLAGPNGAGKSTAAPWLLPAALEVHQFVNADVIARGLSGFWPDSAAVEAGRIMLQRLRELARLRVSFAFETTLAGRMFAPWIAELRQTGYVFELIFLWLPSADLALARVQDRVRAGGHDVGVETVTRRYRRGLANFFRRYRPLADEWCFYDNSGPAPRLLACGAVGQGELVEDPALWGGIQQGIAHE